MNCARPGCGGEIEDGYCNECGLKPAATAPSTTATAPGTPPTPTTSPTSPTPATSTSTSPTQATAVLSGTRATAGSRTSGRGNLGAGLVEIPPIPYRDPTSVVLTDPQVPEHRRYCGTCQEPVGRGRDGRPGRCEGFCPACGCGYSFTPKVQKGDLVAGQYDIVGCIAHGGLGWIYLARDRNVSDRWVVLKGLLDSGDASAMAAAIAERRFLAEVEHPNIVKIFNFVQHDGAGYIVMEYVGGDSLKELRQRGPSGRPEPLPVAQAIAFVLEILPALAYLHARDLVFCDFKPDNVIQAEEQVKLIDLGGVHHLDDDESDLYGTLGYQAPEVPEVGPSIASDLYTVGRTLAVLTFDFRGCQDPARHVSSLPPVDEVEVFGRYPAFHRFLLRATDPDPDARFTDAATMADQLTGVLRQVVAIDGGHPPAIPSRHFTNELLVDVEQPTWRDLPMPKVDPADPGAATLANLATARPDQVVAALERATKSPEVQFRLALARLEIGDAPGAESMLDEVEASQGRDWRATWWRGVLALSRHEHSRAEQHFAELTRELPGELAPLLAGATTREQAVTYAGTIAEVQTLITELEPARAAYELLSITDPTSASAAFGLARVEATCGHRREAANALERVPATSIHATDAAMARCRVLSDHVGGAAPSVVDLADATSTLDRLTSLGPRHTDLVRSVLRSALELLDDGVPGDPDVEVAGVPFTEEGVRAGLERACRSLARSATNPSARVRLVDEANRHRPRSLT